MNEVGDRAAFLAKARERLGGGINRQSGARAAAADRRAPGGPVHGARPCRPGGQLRGRGHRGRRRRSPDRRRRGRRQGDRPRPSARGQDGRAQRRARPGPDRGRAHRGGRDRRPLRPRHRCRCADLGLTGAVAGVAATGSLVLDASVAGSRAAGLLPPVHVCVLREDQLVATPADVLHPLRAGAPSSLVLVGGPSRTGDVEQILTLGVHGPRHVHIVLVEPEG